MCSFSAGGEGRGREGAAGRGKGLCSVACLNSLPGVLVSSARPPVVGPGLQAACPPQSKENSGSPRRRRPGCTSGLRVTSPEVPPSARPAVGYGGWWGVEAPEGPRAGSGWTSRCRAAGRWAPEYAVKGPRVGAGVLGAPRPVEAWGLPDVDGRSLRTCPACSQLPGVPGRGPACSVGWQAGRPEGLCSRCPSCRPARPQGVGSPTQGSVQRC